MCSCGVLTNERKKLKWSGTKWNGMEWNKYVEMLQWVDLITDYTECVRVRAVFFVFTLVSFRNRNLLALSRCILCECAPAPTKWINDLLIVKYFFFLFLPLFLLTPYLMSVSSNSNDDNIAPLPLLPLMTPLLLLLSNFNVHGYGAELWAKAEAEAESKVELVLHKIFSRLHNTRGLGTEHRALSRVQKQYAVVKNWLIRFPLIPLIFVWVNEIFGQIFNLLKTEMPCLCGWWSAGGGIWCFCFACRMNKSMCNQFKSNPNTSN